jgi:hypothetical protein
MKVSLRQASRKLYITNEINNITSSDTWSQPVSGRIKDNAAIQETALDHIELSQICVHLVVVLFSRLTVLKT